MLLGCSKTTVEAAQEAQSSVDTTIATIHGGHAYDSIEALFRRDLDEIDAWLDAGIGTVSCNGSEQDEIQ